MGPAYLLAIAAAATADAEIVEPIVVTGSRLDAAPDATASGQDIHRLQPVSLTEALNDVAGMRAFSTGGDAGGSFLSVRGGEPNFTLVLLEGTRLNNPTNSRGGAFDFLAIDPQAIARIEVAKGAASAVHGSDALSGVINLRLRTPRAEGLRIGGRTMADSEGAFSGGASASIGWASGGLLADTSYFESDGVADGSRLERSQGIVHAMQQAAGFAVQAVGLYGRSRYDRFPEDSGGPRLALLRDLERGRQELAAASLSIRRNPVGALRPGLRLSYSDQRDELNTPPIAPGMLDGTPALTADTRFRRFEAAADLGIRVRSLEAVVGGALLGESGRSLGALMIGFPLSVEFRQHRTTRSLFGEVRIAAPPAVRVELGGRHDDVAGAGSRTTGSAGATWRTRPDAPALFARIGGGYKLPSFYALSHPLVGNPALRPEQSRSIEGGVEQSFGAGQLRLTLFHNRFRNLVDFDGATFALVNRDRVNARGLEIEGRLSPHADLDLAGALTFTDLDLEERLRGRPRWQGNVRVAWRATDRLELHAAVRANSDLFDGSVPTGPVNVDGHAEIDLGLQYRIAPRLGLSVTGRNLADVRFEDAVGFPAKGRLVRIGIHAALD